jgi:hypothetical protein
LHKGCVLGDGESWLLAAEAIKAAGAAPASGTNFGHCISADLIAPGDVLVFNNCCFHGRLHSHAKSNKLQNEDELSIDLEEAARRRLKRKKNRLKRMRKNIKARIKQTKDNCEETDDEEDDADDGEDAMDNGDEEDEEDETSSYSYSSGEYTSTGSISSVSQSESEESTTSEEEIDEPNEEAGKWYTSFVGRPKHTAVVISVKGRDRKIVRVMEQHKRGRTPIGSKTYNFNDLQTGFIQVYRAVTPQT